MSLSTDSVLYEDETVKARIIVGVASVLKGLQRAELTDAGLRHDDDNRLMHIARWTQYPALMAGTISGEIVIREALERDEDGVPTKYKTIETLQADRLSFERFLGLPEELGTAWLGRVFDFNPHWLLDLSAPPPENSEEGKD